MPKFFNIPLSPTPQRFTVTLSGVDYTITVQWREATEGGWFIDISDTTGKLIVAGVPLVTGADLLGQYKHLGFKGRLWVQTANNPDAVPTFENLGTESFVFWVTD